jgi:AcrR family transcriptional regulator
VSNDPVAKTVHAVPRQRLAPDARRSAMLDAGLTLFGSRPYAEVSIRDICEKAGVSRPLLQHYFGSKQAFFVAVIAEAMDELERTTRPTASDQGFTSLRQNLRAFFGFMIEHPVGATIARSDAGGVGEAAQKLFDQYRKRTFELVAGALGKETVSPRTATAIRCWIGMNETIAGQLLCEDSLDADWAAAFSETMLFHLLGEASTQNS